MADISIVIPTLNSAWSLGETLASITCQEDVARVVVVDSGSRDGTLDLCRDFGVDVVYEEPGNMYQAINTGLQTCDTPWLAYTKSDDMWYPDALHRLLAHGEGAGCDLVYGVCDYVDEYGRFLHSMIPPSPSQLRSFFRLGQQPFAQQTAIFTRDLFASVAGFDEEFRLAADFDFFLRAHVAGHRFGRLAGAPVARFRLHGKRLGRRRAAQLRQEVEQSVTRAKLQPGMSDQLVKARWRLRNSGNYLVRLLRRAQLEGKARVTRSVEAL